MPLLAWNIETYIFETLRSAIAFISIYICNLEGVSPFRYMWWRSSLWQKVSLNPLQILSLKQDQREELSVSFMLLTHCLLRSTLASLVVMCFRGNAEKLQMQDFKTVRACSCVIRAAAVQRVYHPAQEKWHLCCWEHWCWEVHLNLIWILIKVNELYSCW